MQLYLSVHDEKKKRNTPYKTLIFSWMLQHSIEYMRKTHQEDSFF